MTLIAAGSTASNTLTSDAEVTWAHTIGTRPLAAHLDKPQLSRWRPGYVDEENHAHPRRLECCGTFAEATFAPDPRQPICRRWPSRAAPCASSSCTRQLHQVLRADGCCPPPLIVPSHTWRMPTSQLGSRHPQGIVGAKAAWASGGKFGRWAHGIRKATSGATAAWASGVAGIGVTISATTYLSSQQVQTCSITTYLSSSRLRQS